MRTINALGIAGAALLVTSSAAAQRSPAQMHETREEMRETHREMHEEMHEETRRAPAPEHMTMEQRQRMEQMRDEAAPRSLAHQGPLSEWGTALSIGGGVYDFTDEDTRDFTDIAGTWELRLTIGTERMVAFDLAYIGGTQNIDAIGLDNDAMLLANGAEGGIRIHLFNAAFKPYFFAGAAYKRYDLVNEDRNTSNLKDDEQLLELPAGLGFAVSSGSFLFDVRGTIRPAVADDGLLRGGDDQLSLHNWRVRAALGGVF